MMSNILQPIEKELHSVHNLIKNQLTIKAGYVGAFAHLELSLMNKTIRPALVILSSRMYGSAPKKAAALASVFQFIYMASKVHQKIPENDSDYIRGDSDPRDGSQFPVLVGDYLYGKFFTFLCDAGIISLLHPLAEIICQIHEGGILKKKVNEQSTSSRAFHEVVHKETAGLFAGCCSLSARLAGAPVKEQELMRRFGESFGMIYGLLEQDISMEHIAPYLKETFSILSMIPDGTERTMLEQLVHHLSGNGRTARRMVI